MVYNIYRRNIVVLHEERGKMQMKKFKGNLLKFLIMYIFFMAVFVFIFRTVFMLTLIPTGSMEGTIMSGDIVFATRYNIGADEIERFDILIFTPPDNPDNTDETYIKRVIGLPGETIEVKNGKVYADGIELDDSFVKKPMYRKGDGIYKVPEGCYFFMGDNRNQSRDSRFWTEKYVPLENIKGKAKSIVYPFTHIHSIEFVSG